MDMKIDEKWDYLKTNSKKMWLEQEYKKNEEHIKLWVLWKDNKKYGDYDIINYKYGLPSEKLYNIILSEMIKAIYKQLIKNA